MKFIVTVYHFEHFYSRVRLCYVNTDQKNLFLCCELPVLIDLLPEGTDSRVHWGGGLCSSWIWPSSPQVVGSASGHHVVSLPPVAQCSGLLGSKLIQIVGSGSENLPVMPADPSQPPCVDIERLRYCLRPPQCPALTHTARFPRKQQKQNASLFFTISSWDSSVFLPSESVCVGEALSQCYASLSFSLTNNNSVGTLNWKGQNISRWLLESPNIALICMSW